MKSKILNFIWKKLMFESSLENSVMKSNGWEQVLWDTKILSQVTQGKTVNPIIDQVLIL